MRFTPALAEQENFSLWQVIQGRSHCDSCGKTLVWFELVPLVSFILQRAKCRGCQARLLYQYPLVELLTGATFFLVSWKISSLFPLFNPQLSLVPVNWVLGLIVLWWLIFTILLVVAIYDFMFYLIPDIFLYALLALGALLNGYYVFLQKSLLFFDSTRLAFTAELGYLLGGAQFSGERVFFGIFFALAIIGLAYVLSRGKAMGFGDVLLGIGLGLVFGWPDILLGMVLSFIFGTGVSLVLMFLKRKTMKSIVPFGPFLILGALTVVLAGDKIISAYFNLFSPYP